MQDSDSSSTTDERLDGVATELEAAASRIIYKTLVTRDRAELTRDEQRFALVACHMYAGHLNRFAFAPNHAFAGRNRPPRGFIMDMRDTAPLFDVGFPERSMFNGIMAFPLDKGENSSLLANGEEVPPGYFSSPLVRERIDKAITEEHMLGDDDTNYAGIFSTTVREGFSERTQYWAVVQCHSTKVSEKFFDALCKNSVAHREANSPGKVTWKAFFGNEAIFKMAEKQREHRARVICALVNACGLGTIADSTAIRDNVQYLLDSEHTIKLTTTGVERVDENSLSFLSDNISTRLVTKTGLILREPGKLGLSLLRGPWGTPSHPRDVGFPCTTGHRVAVRSIRLDELDADQKKMMGTDRVFFWERAEELPYNLNLCTKGVLSYESKERRRIERIFGFDAERGRLCLQPVQVKLHTTSQPK